MSQRVKVWDIFVRVFHWSLVLAFTLAWLSSETESIVHVYAGYVVGGLLLSRVVWGFIGGRHARFRAFCYSPAETLAYIRDSLRGNPRRYLSHNPLGALMVFALLLSLSGTVVTGLVLHGDLPGAARLENAGENPRPAVREDDQDDRDDEPRASGFVGGHEFWEEMHELFANLSLVLAGLHIAGVVVASRLHKEKLVPAMWTGWKDTHDEGG